MKSITLHLLTFTLLLLPGVVFAAQDVVSAETRAAESFVPLVGIPFIEGEKVQTFGDYVNAFYYAAISIAAFLAVVRIIFAGIKYMLSDVVTTKQAAKKDIRSALLGLLIVVGAVLILDTINPNLKKINLFTNAPIPGIGLEDKRPIRGVGDRLLLCEEGDNVPTEEAVEDFNNNCLGYPGLTTDASTGCVVKVCFPQKPTEVALLCDQDTNTCTCNFSESDPGTPGAGSCTEACKTKPLYEDFSIDFSTSLVTCTFRTELDNTECTEPLVSDKYPGCCATSGLINCQAKNDPRQCRSERSPNIPNTTCFFMRPE